MVRDRGGLSVCSECRAVLGHGGIDGKTGVEGEDR